MANEDITTQSVVLSEPTVEVTVMPAVVEPIQTTPPKAKEKNFKVTKNNSTKLKHSGIASDFVDASVDGKEIGKYRKKSLYHEDDSIDELEKSTAELVGDSSRKILKTMEEEENKRLNELVNRTYYPKAKEEFVTQKELVLAALNIV